MERRGVLGCDKDGLLLLSVRQRTVVSVRSQKSRRWLIHKQSSWMCVCVCVQSLQDTQWLTDWQGHGWASLHQHRRLLWCAHPPFTHHSQLNQSCDCPYVWLGFVVFFPVRGVLFLESEPQSFCLPSTIKVEVCLGGAVAEPCRLMAGETTQGQSSRVFFSLWLFCSRC